jgi:nicotinamidase-related amidase
MTAEPTKMALLVMDVQPGIVDRLENKTEFLNRIQATINTARHGQVRVIFVVVGFRPDLPEISPTNKSFSSLAEPARTRMINPRPLIELHPTDILVTKRRVSAFTGSDLEVVLRGQDVRHVVLTGIATSGVILSTLREASDKDYRITVLSDLCADTDAEVHRVLMEKVFPKQAAVIESEQWVREEIKP